jgi:hypothetical protein
MKVGDLVQILYPTNGHCRDRGLVMGPAPDYPANKRGAAVVHRILIITNQGEIRDYHERYLEVLNV